MSSNFEKNSIRLTETPATKVSPPETSKDIKLFQENGEVKVKDFSGQVKPLVPPQQELKVAKAEVNTNEDATEYVLRIPSPNAKLEALEKTLRQLIDTKADEVAINAAVEDLRGIITSYQDSQNLANGIVDTNISEIEQKVSEILQILPGKVDTSDFTSLQAQLAQFIQNINASLATKATKTEVASAIAEVRAEIPKPVAIVADSNNVTITKKDENTYGISVEVQEKVIETVVERVAGAGGVSKKFVMDYVEDALSGYTPGISGGGSAGIQGRFQLDAVNTTFTITHSAIDETVEFPVASLEVADANSDLHIIGIHDRTSTSFQVTLSGIANANTYLLWHISTQNSSTMTTIASSGASIIVTQSGNNYNLEVASAPPQNLVDLQDVDATGVVNGQVLKYLNGTWVASPDLSGSGAATWGNIIGNIGDQSDLQVALDAKVDVAGDTMTGTLAMSGAGIQLDINHTPAHSEGKIFYDADSHTLSYFNDNSDVKINVGQEEVVRVRNDTGSTISNGQVVCISGSSGSHPLIVLADNTSPDLSHSTLGVATHDISDNENGYVTVSGLVNGLNTNSFSSEGVTLWLGTSGNLTETEPTAPTHKVKIGYLIRKHISQGSILVAIDTGSDLGDLHDVSIGDYDDGAILVANGSVWSPGANINDYTLLSTTESISGNLQTQINNKVSLIGQTGSVNLSGADVVVRDSNFSIVDDSNPTKVAKFEVSTIGAGVTRTFTFPNTNGNIALGSGASNRLSYWVSSNTMSSSTTLLADTTNGITVSTTAAPTAATGTQIKIGGGQVVAASQIVASNFVSTVSLGTPPISASSTTLCPNLNADLLDGQHGSYFTPLSTTESISGDLQSQISDLTVTLGDYTLLSTTASISASLEQDIANLDLDLQDQITDIGIYNATVSSISGSSVTLDYFPHYDDEGLVEWLVSISNGTDIRASRLLVSYGNSAVASNEDLVTSSGDTSDAALTATIDAMNVYLKLTSSTNWNIKSKRITI